MIELKTRTLNWLMILYVAAVLYVSTVNITAPVKLHKIKILTVRSDYWLHFFLFIPWMILADWRWRSEVRGKKLFWLALTAGVLISACAEGFQLLLPFRAFKLMDLVANCLGIVTGAVISQWGFGRKRIVEIH